MCTESQPYPLGEEKKMNLLKIIVGLLLLSSLAIAETQKQTFKIYTVRQRKLCLTSEIQTSKPPFGGTNVTDNFDLDEKTLLKIFDSLRDHLYKNLTLDRCGERDYQLDNIVFRFYDYYLQIIPYKEETIRMIYINAYTVPYDDKTLGDEALPKKEFISVKDGGSNYWQIRYNLDTGKFDKININGHA